jgi:hypothetical protein
MAPECTAQYSTYMKLRYFGNILDRLEMQYTMPIHVICGLIHCSMLLDQMRLFFRFTYALCPILKNHIFYIVRSFASNK